MLDDRDEEQRYDPARHGLGGEGTIVDLTAAAPSTDPEIARGVRSSLVLDPDVEEDHFQVEVEDGVVYLAGEPSSPEEADRAVADVELVHGVRRVVKRLAD
jgi:osmotically-inducible protein OsmY